MEHFIGFAINSLCELLQQASSKSHEKLWRLTPALSNMFGTRAQGCVEVWEQKMRNVRWGREKKRKECLRVILSMVSGSR